MWTEVGCGTVKPPILSSLLTVVVTPVSFGARVRLLSGREPLSHHSLRGRSGSGDSLLDPPTLPHPLPSILSSYLPLVCPPTLTFLPPFYLISPSSLPLFLLLPTFLPSPSLLFSFPPSSFLSQTSTFPPTFFSPSTFPLSRLPSYLHSAYLPTFTSTCLPPLRLPTLLSTLPTKLKGRTGYKVREDALHLT